MKPIKVYFSLALTAGIFTIGACVKSQIEGKDNYSEEMKSTARSGDVLKYSKNWQYTADSTQVAIYLLKPESWPQFAVSYTNVFEVRRYFRTRNSITKMYDIVYWKNSSNKTIATFTVSNGILLGSLKMDNGRITPYNCNTCLSMSSPPPMLSYSEWLAQWCAQMPSSLLCQPAQMTPAGNNDCCVLESLIPDGGNPQTCPPTCAGGGGILSGSGEASAITNALQAWDNSIVYDQLKPCEQKILDTVKGLQSGKLARIIRDLYGSIPGFNWRVMDTPVLVAGAMDANAVTLSTPGAIETYLVQPMMKDGTNLFYVATLLHEAAHAFLYSYFYYNAQIPSSLRDSMLQASYGKQLQKFMQLKNPNNNEAQHELLLNFQNDIYGSLLEYCQKAGMTGTDVYNACLELSWMGLQDTDYYTTHFSASDDEAIRARWEANRKNVLQYFSGGSVAPTGTKICP